MSSETEGDSRIIRLHEAFSGESDRAAAIVAGALLDEAVLRLLDRRLAPAPHKDRSITGGANAPLGAFSTRIDACCQLGLISKHLAADLHLIRRVRNDFAHSTDDLSFDSGPIRDRVRALEVTSGFNKRYPAVREAIGPAGSRNDFLGIAAWILYELECQVNEVVPLVPRNPEFGYVDWSSLPDDVLTMLKNSIDE